MMQTKNVLFIGRRETRPDYDTAASMARAIESVANGAHYSACDFEDLVFAFDGQRLKVVSTKLGQDISQFDTIFLLGWFTTKELEDTAMSVAVYAEAHNIPVFNSEVCRTRSRTKLSQCVLAAMHGVSCVPFVCSLDNFLSLQYMRENPIGYPLIVKSTIAARGRDNYLVHTQHELESILKEQQRPGVSFIMQSFVPNNGDYRLIVMGDRVRLVMHRQSPTGSHINNTSQGGVATLVDVSEVDQAMLEDAVKMARLVRREVTGVDMIVHRDTGKFYLLEVNNMPQLSTGKFVTEKMRVLQEFLDEQLR
jgi:glutathione synthase/RimK-type ligase-like ATP-grasp enzyme